MKKRTLALLVMLALVLTAVFALVACEPQEENPTVTHKVSFYDGTKKIHEVDVEDGKTVQSYTYNKEGMTFVAWYEDSSLAGDPFDFTQAIKGKTQLFGKWQSDTVEADTRIWYVMGSVEEASWEFPTVKNEETGVWSVKEGKESQIMAKDATKNEYTITLTVRPGQKFRFVTGAINSDWTGDESKAEAGLGNIVGFEFAAGTNPEGGAEVDAASKQYGCVKKDGAVVFEGGKEYNDSPMQWNIFATEESAAVFKFTLKTFPGEDDRNTITWERVSDLPKLDKTFVPVIAGSMQGWKATAEEGLAMTAKDVNSLGEGTWIYVFEIDTISADKAKEEFKVVNIASGTQWLGNAGEGKLGEGGNFEITENGTWMVAIDSVNKTYKLEKAAIRVVGTIDGQGWADGTQRGEGYKDNMYVMNKVASATEGVEKYELVLEITADHAASWLATGKVAAIKVDFCACGYSIWDCGEGENGGSNIEFTELGWYKVTLELSYNAEKERQTKVTVAKTTAPDYAAKIGGKGFETLEAALEAAKANSTIVLQKNVVLAAQLNVNKKITLDLNGKTISNTVDIWNDADGVKTWSLISVRANGDLTITGNGKLDSKADDCFAVDVRDGGKLVIENGEFVGNLHTIYVHTGSAVINGGKFNLQQLDSDKIAAGGNGYEFMLNLYDANGKNGTAKITVNGGSFVEFDPSNSKSEDPQVSFVPVGCEVKSATVEGKTIYTVSKLPVETISLKEYAAAHEVTNGTKVEALEGTTAATITASGTATGSQWGSNTGKYYDNDASNDGVGNWRIYQNENPAVTITAKQGYKVVGVVINYTVDKTGVLLLGEEQVASGEAVAVNDNTITFTVGNTGDKTNGQVRIISIEIIYAPVEAAA